MGSSVHCSSTLCSYCVLLAEFISVNNPPSANSHSINVQTDLDLKNPKKESCSQSKDFANHFISLDLNRDSQTMRELNCKEEKHLNQDQTVYEDI